MAYSSLWLGSTGGGCIILTSALEDDNFYLCTQTIGAENISMKMNKLTIVNNAVVVGNDINSTTTAKGTEELTGSCFGILSACYSSGSYNHASGNQMVYIEFLDASDNVLLSFNFSEGAGQQVFDVISGNAYAIYNITEVDFWNYTQDFNHYNFRYGFTLYQKAGADDIRVPNKKDDSEITPASVPSGYSRIANYKECRQTFNQCESKFKLDDVSAGIEQIEATFNKAFWGSIFPLSSVFVADGEINGKTRYISSDSDEIRWNGAYWGLYSHTYPSTSQLYSYLENIEDVLAAWTGANQTFTLSSSTPSPLFSADIDNVLFDVDGAAKEINVGTLDVNIGIDRGYLYINPNISEHDFMLYGTNKTLESDVKIIKYIGLGNEIIYDENDDILYDGNDHTILE